MIRPIDLPVVLSQAPLAQHLQVAAQNAPGAHQAFLSHLVVQKQQREADQIAKTEKSQQTSSTVKERNSQDGSSSGEQHTPKENKEEEFIIPEEDDHILDIKV